MRDFMSFFAYAQDSALIVFAYAQETQASNSRFGVDGVQRQRRRGGSASRRTMSSTRTETRAGIARCANSATAGSARHRTSIPTANARRRCTPSVSRRRQGGEADARARRPRSKPKAGAIGSRLCSLARAELRHRADTVREREDLHRRAADLIERDLHLTSLSLERVAAELGVSPRHLQRVFKEVGGTTYRGHVEALRMTRAAELLAGELPGRGVPLRPVREVAAMVGYNQAAGFAKAFRRYWGEPPHRMRADER